MSLDSDGAMSNLDFISQFHRLALEFTDFPGNYIMLMNDNSIGAYNSGSQRSGPLSERTVHSVDSKVLLSDYCMWTVVGINVIDYTFSHMPHHNLLHTERKRGQFDASPTIIPNITVVKREHARSIVLVGTAFSEGMWVFFGPFPAKRVLFRSAECCVVECLSECKLEDEPNENSCELPIICNFM